MTDDLGVRAFSGGGNRENFNNRGESEVMSPTSNIDFLHEVRTLADKMNTGINTGETCKP